MLAMDFDGNVTDVEKEAGPYTEGWLKDLATLLGVPIDVVQERARITYEEIAKDPAKYGWRFAGENMAPSTVDPYLRVNAIGRKLLCEDSTLVSNEVFDRLSQVFYAHHYQKTLDAPKPELAAFLTNCFVNEVPVRFVTNSGTDPVRKKIDRVLFDRPLTKDWWNARVIGNARKYDPNCNDENALWPFAIDRIRFDSFPRDTVLKRPHYLKILNDLQGDGWARKHDLVVGDIFELDLALPLWLGCHIGLMVNEHTPAWEIKFVSEHPRGRILHSIDEVLPYYEYIQTQT